MQRKVLVDEVMQHGDDRKAMVVDLGGGVYVDVESVRYDAEGKVIVLVADQDDLEGALGELMAGRGMARFPGASGALP